MKPLQTLFITLLFACASTAPTIAAAPAEPVQTPAPVPPDPKMILPHRADPHILLHTDGFYYFMATVPEYDRLELRRTRSLAELAQAPTKIIWKRHAEGDMGGFIWAPEIHFIDGKWYVYFAAGGSKDRWHIRMFVLENTSENPMEGTWTEKGQIKMAADSFTLDATTFTHQGARYLAWAQNTPGTRGTSIYLAKMDTPWSLQSPQVIISKPEFAWEKVGFLVNEGPAVLEKNGYVFLTFSASKTDANYCLGMITARAEANLLDPASWKKTPEPVFKTNPAASEYGPGHNAFTTTPDGRTDLLVYHARTYEKIVGDPLFNPDRGVYIKAIRWKSDGTPDFGRPGEDVLLPSSKPAAGQQ